VNGLVDELHLMIGPSFLGAGTPVFGGRSPVSLRLLESRTLEDSELVLSRYGLRAGVPGPVERVLGQEA
jgi:dihydrofolate reductase